MADEKLLTIPNLIAALKDAGFATKGDLAGFVTKDDLKELRKQVADDTLRTLAEFQRGEVDPKFDKLRTEMRKGFMQVNSRLERVENELRWLKDDVEGLKADLSNTPSRKEFEKVKATVARISPAL